MAVCNLVCFFFGFGTAGLWWPHFDEEIKEKGKVEKMVAVAGLLDDLGYEDVETFIKEKFTSVKKVVKK